MKRLGMLMLSIFLVLTGCSQSSALVAESIKKSFALDSYESKSTITFTGSLPTDQADEKTRLLLTALKDGLVIETQQKSKEEGHLRLTVKNPAAITGSQLWPGKAAPAIDLYGKGSDVYLKSSIDQKFLALSSQEPTAPQKAVQGQLKQFFTDFVSQYDYTLKNVETVGQESVTLPNGDTVDATHVRISLDLQEALELAAFTFDNLSKFQGLEQLGSLTGEEVSPSEIEQLRNSLSEAAKQIKSLKAEDLKAQGFDGNLVLNYWIDADKQTVQSEIELALALPGAANTPAEPVSFKIHLFNQYWNQNKTVGLAFPTADQTVTEDQLKQNPKLLDLFDPASPVRFLATDLAKPKLPPFNDVPEGYWGYQPITYLHEKGIISGYDGNEFKPEKSITRAEFITMTVKTLGIKLEQSDLTFKDKNQIPGWAESYVQTAVKAGLIKGYDDGTLRPNQPITRAEMVTILVNGLHLPLDENASLNYTDRNAIPDWALKYVKTASSEGLVHGYADGSFAPNDQAKRAEVAAVLYNAIINKLQ